MMTYACAGERVRVRRCLLSRPRIVQDAAVRSTTLDVLLPLYEDEAVAEAISMFTERFTDRFVEMCRDVDAGVAAKAFELCEALHRHGALQPAHVDALCRLLWASHAPLRAAAGRFVAGVIATAAAAAAASSSSAPSQSTPRGRGRGAASAARAAIGTLTSVVDFVAQHFAVVDAARRAAAASSGAAAAEDAADPIASDGDEADSLDHSGPSRAQRGRRPRAQVAAPADDGAGSAASWPSPAALHVAVAVDALWSHMAELADWEAHVDVVKRDARAVADDSRSTFAVLLMCACAFKACGRAAFDIAGLGDGAALRGAAAKARGGASGSKATVRAARALAVR